MLDIGYHYVAVDASGNPLDIDSDGVPDYLEDAQWNGLPDLWQWYWFGNCDHAGSELDANGNTLLYDYSNGLDPNIIVFTLSATNSYVNQTSVPLQIVVLAGVPSYYAVLVNDTNAANANWQRFTSTNLTVMTPTDGVYVVSVGLCGSAPTATRTWQTVTLFRDTTPLGLMLTNLPSLTGSRPFIDPAGYTTRALSSLTWTLIDANGNTNSGNGAVVRRRLEPLRPVPHHQLVPVRGPGAGTGDQSGCHPGRGLGGERRGHELRLHIRHQWRQHAAVADPALAAERQPGQR